MPCPAINSGSKFVSTMLAHIDCQAQHIGAYGYGALADPGSNVSVVLTGLLVIFVAITAVRLMVGYSMNQGDLLGTFFKLGIVLTLATSWPAWRVVGYDVLMQGPAEIAQTIAGSADVPGGNGDVNERLQAADEALVSVTAYGTGRLPGSDLRDEFRGFPLPDESGFGWGRVFFLLGVIAPFAIVRLGAGLLLALAPLIAGAFLFDRASAIFFGWVRGLAFVFLGSLSVTVFQGVQLAILEPWIQSVASLRTSGAFTPSAPTELTVVALVFVIAQAGALLLFARLAFLPHLSVASAWRERFGPATIGRREQDRPEVFVAIESPPSRAQAIAGSMASAIRRESITSSLTGEATFRHSVGQPASPSSIDPAAQENMLGTSYRRGNRRSTATSLERDRKL
jgi:type IV secretion system protein VirB6